MFYKKYSDYEFLWGKGVNLLKKIVKMVTGTYPVTKKRG